MLQPSIVAKPIPSDAAGCSIKGLFKTELSGAPTFGISTWNTPLTDPPRRMLVISSGPAATACPKPRAQFGIKEFPQVAEAFWRGSSHLPRRPILPPTVGPSGRAPGK